MDMHGYSLLSEAVEQTKSLVMISSDSLVLVALHWDNDDDQITLTRDKQKGFPPPVDNQLDAFLALCEDHFVHFHCYI